MHKNLDNLKNSLYTYITMNKEYLLITNKDNIVKTVESFSSPEVLEVAFQQECDEYGIQVQDENFDDGYIELECGTSICMVHI